MGVVALISKFALSALHEVTAKFSLFLIVILILILTISKSPLFLVITKLISSLILLKGQAAFAIILKLI